MQGKLKRVVASHGQSTFRLNDERKDGRVPNPLSRPDRLAVRRSLRARDGKLQRVLSAQGKPRARRLVTNVAESVDRLHGKSVRAAGYGTTEQRLEARSRYLVAIGERHPPRVGIARFRRADGDIQGLKGRADGAATTAGHHRQRIHACDGYMEPVLNAHVVMSTRVTLEWLLWGVQHRR